MTVPKASIHDLINSSNTSTGASSASLSGQNAPKGHNAIENFISMLGKYAQPIEDTILNTAGDLGAGAKEALVSPVRETINTAQGKPYQAPSASAQRGLDTITGTVLGAPPELAPEVDLGGIAAQAKGAVNDTKAALNDISHTVSTTPGGFQAGFIKPKATIGGRTAEELQAAKAAGEPRVVNQAAETPHADFAYGNKPTTPLPVHSETLPPTPEPVGAPQEPITRPYPDVSDEPKLVTDRTGKHPVTGGNPVLVDLRNEANKNPYYLEDQARSRDVMDKYISGNTPLEVEQNLPLQLTEETQRIKNIMAKKPGATANISDIIAQNEANLKKAGISPGVSTKADTATHEALNELDSQISTKAGITGKTAATGEDLVNYKNILDDKLKSAYKKQDNGGSLTAGENAMRTLRRTINEKLKEMYPGMGDALDRQAAMIDARPSVAKAAGAQEKDQVVAASQPKPSLIDRAKAHPVGAMAFAGATAYGLPKIIGAGIGLSQNYLQNRESAASASLKPLGKTSAPAKPTYDITTPLDDGTITPQKIQADAQAQLQAKINAEKLNDPNQANIDQGTYDANQTKFDAQSDLRKVSGDTQTLVQTANNIASELPNIPASFVATAFNQGYDAANKATNGQYSGLVANLKNLSNLSGVDLSTAKTPAALQSAIDKIVELQKTKLETARTQYAGPKKGTGIAPLPVQTSAQSLPATPQSIVNWQQNDPAVQAIQNQSALPSR